MRRERIFLILGIWVAILPFLGFPYSWKNVLFTISGLILMYYSYKMHKENKVPTESRGSTTAEAIGKKSFDNFSEENTFDATKN